MGEQSKMSTLSIGLTATTLDKIRIKHRFYKFWVFDTIILHPTSVSEFLTDCAKSFDILLFNKNVSFVIHMFQYTKCLSLFEGH